MVLMIIPTNFIDLAVINQLKETITLEEWFKSDRFGWSESEKPASAQN
jgi:hypothetical protein